MVFLEAVLVAARRTPMAMLTQMCEDVIAFVNVSTFAKVDMTDY